MLAVVRSANSTKSVHGFLYFPWDSVLEFVQNRRTCLLNKERSVLGSFDPELFGPDEALLEVDIATLDPEG